MSWVGSQFSRSVPQLDFSFHSPSCRGEERWISVHSGLPLFPWAASTFGSLEGAEPSGRCHLAPIARSHEAPLRHFMFLITSSFILVGVPVTSSVSHLEQRDHLAAPAPTDGKGRNAKDNLEMETWADVANNTLPCVLLDPMLRVLHFETRFASLGTCTVPYISLRPSRSAVPTGTFYG